MSELIDNRAHRIRTLKEIISTLHRGGDPESAREKLRVMVGETTSSEIAAMEQELIADGMAVEEIQSMCDLHSQVLREVLIRPLAPDAVPGHPLDTFRRENRAVEEVVGELRQRLVESSGEVDLVAWRSLYGRLMDLEKHYRRKENLLFSCLERHGVTGPSKVMWGKDDEVRELLAALGEVLDADALSGDELALVGGTVLEPALAAVAEMISKEERVLFPMAWETLTEEEWAEIWRDSPRYGYCLVGPREGYRPPRATAPTAVAAVGDDEALVLPTGALSVAQLEALLAVLPVDLTFVDADDRVRYFSEGPDRVFERSKAILGRKVQHCHPPKSVHTVEEILARFRAGQEDVAEFWIQLHGRFVHIRYFAVRSESGEYLGTLELTQDLTRLRALDGERRLLQFAEEVA